MAHLIKKFSAFVVDFTVWSWKDKDHNRLIMYFGAASMTSIAVILTAVVS